MRPPRPARALVRALARADDRASVLGDLDAEFERLALAGPVRDARRWYWRQALVSAGPLLRTRVELRMRRPAGGAMEDARQGARWVRRHPWLSATVAATLAIALGAALAALAVAEAAVWHPLPYPQPDRIVRVWVTGPTRPAAVRAVSRPDFLDWRAIRSFGELSAYAPASLRLSARGDAILPAIAARVHDLDPSMPLARTATLTRRLEDARETEVFRAALVLALAAIASALAALGAYTVTAYAATARAREFGVRLALGERPRSIAARAIWTAAAPSLHGIALGALVAVAAGRWLDAFLYEVKAYDFATLAMVALLLGGLSLAARRALGDRRRAHRPREHIARGLVMVAMPGRLHE